MKILKTAALPIALSALLVLGGCAGFIGPETTVTGSQRDSSLEINKVFLSSASLSLARSERLMETKNG